MSQLENQPIDTLQEGMQRRYQKTLSENDIALFAATSGDLNPVHLDADYAATTVFKQPIAHGMWTGALISAAIATQLPGPGSVYRGQTLSFKRPVVVGDCITVTLTVLSVKARSKRVILQCEAHNQNDELVAVGEADVIAPADKLIIATPTLPAITVGGSVID